MTSAVVSVKEQLIALTLELDDKTKVNELLTRRVERARQDFETCSSSTSTTSSSGRGREQPLQQPLQEEQQRHRLQAEALTSKTQSAVAEKAQLIADLKERVSEIQQAEHDMQAEIRALYREAEKDLDLERKRFKAGYEDRLQKVCMYCLFYYHSQTFVCATM